MHETPCTQQFRLSFPVPPLLCLLLSPNFYIDTLPDRGADIGKTFSLNQTLIFLDEFANMCGWRLGGGARLQHPRNEIIEFLMMARRCTSDSLHCTSPVGCILAFSRRYTARNGVAKGDVPETGSLGCEHEAYRCARRETGSCDPDAHAR